MQCKPQNHGFLCKYLVSSGCLKRITQIIKIKKLNSLSKHF